MRRVRLIMSASIVGVGSFAPSVARAADGATSDPLTSYLHLALLAIGLLLAARWSADAFAEPPVKIGDLPTPPCYMTPRDQYRLGCLAFVLVSALLYVVVAYLHKEALPAIALFSPELYAKFKPYVEGDGASYLMVVALISAAFLTLLKAPAAWNPLLVLRSAIYGWVSIPHLVGMLIERARNALAVPPEGRALVVGNPLTPYVADGDFMKDRQSLDRRWAELSYLRAWLEREEAAGSHATFFYEPSFAWTELKAAYQRLAARIGSLKSGEAGRPEDFVAASSDIDELRGKMCRLVACFLVFRNETQRAIFDQARELGIPIVSEGRPNPLRYAVVYLLALAFSVYAGVYLTAVLFDAVTGPGGLAAALAQENDLVWRWVGFAASNTGVPILAVFAARYLGWRTDRGRDRSYLMSYCWIFLAAFCIAPPSLATAVKLLGSETAAATPFPTLWWREFQWAIVPALICVYVAYYLDRQTDPHLPNIDADGRGGAVRLWQAVLFALVVVLLLLPPTASIHAAPGSIWITGKLQTVALGTTFLMTLTLALVAQFVLPWLAKPLPPSAAAAAPVAETPAAVAVAGPLRQGDFSLGG